jgi:hypothetical protein
MSGIYSYLPLATSVEQKILQVIRKLRFIVDLLEELEVGVDHGSNVIEDTVIKGKLQQHGKVAGGQDQGSDFDRLVLDVSSLGPTDGRRGIGCQAVRAKTGSASGSRPAKDRRRCS